LKHTRKKQEARNPQNEMACCSICDIDLARAVMYSKLNTESSLVWRRTAFQIYLPMLYKHEDLLLGETHALC